MADETTSADKGQSLPPAEAEASGLPQLDFSTFDNQIFWLIVTLIAIYLILSRVALPRIASVLAERKGTITNDIAKAEELKQAALAAAGAHPPALIDLRAGARLAGRVSPRPGKKGDTPHARRTRRTRSPAQCL